MGKKVDLNARRTSNNIRKSTHSFNYYNNPTNLSQEGTNSTGNQNSNGLGTNDFYNEEDYELPKSADITIKTPLAGKKVLICIIIIIIFSILIAYMSIFGEDYTLISGKYTLGQTCAKVTVTDTENYIYDGEVSFNDYIAGVVAAESQGSHDLEYLKLLVVLARTYFFENATSSCTVKGNSEFQQYKDVDDVNNRHVIKKAMEETEDFVITENDKLIAANYSLGCVVREDSSNYYIRYGKNTGQVKFQQISKSWSEESWTFDELDYLYSITEETIEEMRKEFEREQAAKKAEAEENGEEYEVQQFIVDYETIPCPDNTSDNGVSKIGALYLINDKYYEYQKVIEYYNGNKIEIIKNEINHSSTTTSSGDYVNPIGTISCTSAYGSRNHPVKGESSFHTGLDISASGGSPIYAAKDGIISKVVKNITAINNCTYGYGNQVVIDHGDGTSTLYAHMKYGTIPDSISVGTKVSQGEQIGQVGSTGCSTGNHLHYEVLVNGSTVDPADYLDLSNAAGTCKR